MKNLDIFNIVSITASIGAVLLAVASIASEPAQPTTEITCARFATQEEAQSFYEQHVEHWWTLDPQQKGIACPLSIQAMKGEVRADRTPEN